MTALILDLEVDVPGRTDSTLVVTHIGMDAEFGWVVKGTTDVDVASLALVAHRLANPIDEDTESAMYGLTNEQMQDPETRERAYAIPQVSRVGWFRWNPCSRQSCEDGGGHRGHLDTADGPGPGNWVGVRFEDPWFA